MWGNVTFFLISDLQGYSDQITNKSDLNAKFNLVANIVHHNSNSGPSYKVHLTNLASGHWYQIQDLIVEQVVPEMVPLSEAYIQVALK